MNPAFHDLTNLRLDNPRSLRDKRKRKKSTEIGPDTLDHVSVFDPDRGSSDLNKRIDICASANMPCMEYNSFL